jgi:hypothetical protein
VIPVEYILTEKGLEASILASQIQETKNDYHLATISMMPFFGAGSINNTGYLMVPDGSGATIDFNQPSPLTYTYDSPIYGRDEGTPIKQNRTVSNEVRLPVYGINRNDGGFIAIITQGDADAILNATISGVKHSYNSAYFEFRYRSSDSVQLKSQTWDSRYVSVYDSVVEVPDRFTVRYIPMGKDACTYTDMPISD